MNLSNKLQAGLAAGALALCVSSASATDLAVPSAGVANMWLVCENGRYFPIRPLAVSRESDLVTGYLLNVGNGRSVHLRLVPMGNGYRYAGAGIWFDGVRGDAVLSPGQAGAVACEVIWE